MSLESREMKRPSRIEDYAMIGDFRTAALISREGSMDWLCTPRFDSSACFASLLGTEENGFWSIRPRGEFTVTRKYRKDTLILETEFTTSTGKVRLVDCMLSGYECPKILRVVNGLEGQVEMLMELVIRFDYGSVTPWVTRTPFGGIRAAAGINSLRLKSSQPTYGRNMRTHSDFILKAGEHAPFLLSWLPSHEAGSEDIDEPANAFERQEIWWQDWIAQCNYNGPYKEAVHRSLITLKALTFRDTGGIIAALTTSLPEQMGGARNWDYRYCWLRDSTFTLRALLTSGYREEAMAWRDWLLRAIAGTPDQIQIMYGIGGERDLLERELDYLPGFGGSKPVRIGNAASTQFQLDIYGGILDSFFLGQEHGLRHERAVWRLARRIISFVIENWRKPDAGIWEVRGPEQHFVYSKCMCWQVLDRGIKMLKGQPDCNDALMEKWTTVADEIREDILKNGYDEELESFVQAYGSKTLDASTLLITHSGMIPATDPRMINTTKAIEGKLLKNGFVKRYITDETNDGLEGDEGAFLACSFWLVDNWVAQGEKEKATELFERVMNIQNDVGLFAEEYDGKAKQFLGNFPQAFTHVALINSAFRLAEAVQNKTCEAHEKMKAVDRGHTVDPTSDGPSNGQSDGQSGKKKPIEARDWPPAPSSPAPAAPSNIKVQSPGK